MQASACASARTAPRHGSEVLVKVFAQEDGKLSAVRSASAQARAQDQNARGRLWCGVFGGVRVSP
eukprot:366571-Chlamydomonas_euryale.AAC.35